jgi:hypothetical protein
MQQAHGVTRGFACDCGVTFNQVNAPLPRRQSFGDGSAGDASADYDSVLS